MIWELQTFEKHPWFYSHCKMLTAYRSPIEHCNNTCMRKHGRVMHPQETAQWTRYQLNMNSCQIFNVRYGQNGNLGSSVEILHTQMKRLCQQKFWLICKIMLLRWDECRKILVSWPWKQLTDKWSMYSVRSAWVV